MTRSILSSQFLWRCAVSLGLLAASAALPVMAATAADPASCAACHGANGMGNAAAGYPRLAGLPKAYIEAQLKAFADGQRNNALMSAMAKPLSAADIAHLAAYYSGLHLGEAPLAKAPSAEQAALGETLVHQGDWSKGIPACIRCHGPGLEGVGTVFPPLLGQPAAYIEAQIKAWKEGTRRGDPQALMQTVALRMSDAQTQAAAAWLAAQPVPGPKAAAPAKKAP